MTLISHSFMLVTQNTIDSVYPRVNGAKVTRTRVTNSARLFTPREMRTQRSAKFINGCGHFYRHFFRVGGRLQWVEATYYACDVTDYMLGAFQIQPFK